MDWNKISQQMKNNPQLIEQLANSADGQALMQMLNRDGGDSVSYATAQGNAGNYAEMTKLLKNVMANPEGRALLQRLSRQIQP